MSGWRTRAPARRGRAADSMPDIKASMVWMETGKNLNR